MDKMEKKSFIQKDEKIFYLFFVVLLFLQVLLIFFSNSDNHLIGGDGAYYFAYLRSIMFDHDINLNNEIALYNSILPVNHPDNVGMLNLPQIYAFPIGTSILWAPFFIFAHLLALILVLFGINVPLNGYSVLHEASVYFAGMFYGFIGILLIYRFSKHFFSENISLISTIILIFSSSAIYYILIEPSMSHAPSMFAVSLFLYLLYFYPSRGGILGLSAGLMLLVRWQDAIFLCALLYKTIFDYTPKKDFTKLKNFIITIVTAFITFIPQLLLWKNVYGKFILIPQGNNFINWFTPKIPDILFSTQHGLISWTPVILICLIGLILFYQKEKKIFLSLVTIFLLNLYVNACVAGDLGGGASFGMRRFVDCSIVFVIGLCAFIEFINQKITLKTTTIILSLLIIWNGLFIVQYRLGFVDPEKPLSWQEMTVDKFFMLFKVMDKIKEIYNRKIR